MDDLLLPVFIEPGKSIYWCVDARRPSECGAAGRAIGRNFHRLEIDGFDELMGELSRAERRRPLRHTCSGASQQAPHPSMNGRSLTFRGLDQELMLSTPPTAKPSAAPRLRRRRSCAAKGAWAGARAPGWRCAVGCLLPAVRARRSGQPAACSGRGHAQGSRTVVRQLIWQQRELVRCSTAAVEPA
jgi:transposase